MTTDHVPEQKAGHPAADNPPPVGRTRRPALWRDVLGSRQARWGIGLILVPLLTAFIGPLVRPYGPNNLVGIPGTAPSGTFLLGTDDLGRDVLSRLLSGGTQIIAISVIAIALAYAGGLGIGLLAAYRGGWVDTVTIRALDVAYAIPILLVFIIAVSAFGSSTFTLTVLLAAAFVPSAARVVRSVTRSIARKDYVAAAEARGESLRWIFLGEIVPNAIGPLIADCCQQVTGAVLGIATLNYLGLGVQPPTPDWGGMISENQNIISSNPWAVLAPAILIASLTLGINLIGDVLAHHASREVRRTATEL